MIKKIIPLFLILMFFGGYSFAFEVGLTIGSMSQSTDSGLHYGIAGGMGFLIPMIKFEIEIYKMKDKELYDKPNAITAGVKFRPKLSRLTPYAIIGVGSEFEKLGFSFSEFKNFVFIGGGVHFYLARALSIRADLRFMNFSNTNKTRLSAGIFIHL